MKSLKMLGLGALTVLLAIALGGAPSAMAEGTGLCSVDESPCENENIITHVHQVTPEGKKAAVLTSFGNVECDVLFLGEVFEDETEAPVLLEGNFTYSNCKGPSESKCEMTETSESSLLSILKEGHETALVTGEANVNVGCGFINCTYSREALSGQDKGPLLSTLENGEISISKQTLEPISGLLCPKTNTLDITTTPLTETFQDVRTVYCVNYSNSRGRYKLHIDSKKCTGWEGFPPEFNYELVWLRQANLGPGDMVCIFHRDPFGDHQYLGRNGSLCETKDKEPEGNYELGEIATN